MKKKIAKCIEIKDVPYSVLENLKLEHAKAFIRDLNRRDIQVNKNETKKPEKESVNRKISALRSLFKYLTTQTEKDNGEPYFYRNVMLKIEVTKVKETKIFLASFFVRFHIDVAAFTKELRIPDRTLYSIY
nr:hypothetical protein [Cytobacillus solani]